MRPTDYCTDKPLIDGVGRRIFRDSVVKLRRGRKARLPNEPVFYVEMIFDFCEERGPEIEIRSATGKIVAYNPMLTGGCWKFDNLLVVS